jgi:hypothetical protein
VTAPFDAQLLEAHDLIMALDYGQFSIATAYDDDVNPVAVLDRALADDGIAQEGPLATLLSPHQNNFEMPLRVEVWSAEPPDDATEWPEAFELHLEVGEEGVYVDSPTLGGHRVPVPPGSFRALVTGRGFVARGWPGSTTPGDAWRIRLWPADVAVSPRRLRAWTG